ncbi:hypothetical protein OCT63_17150 [Vibrio sp. RW]|uniref:hypothetical protein n=1 Tax=Vibrio sp. RW TaxID=2998833 RepID=UPI0022CD62FC|nr:hypothetical protein [Vibrio sp. RW]MDA0145955.1 hypothetical protein [Vibrio sp. RW]
MKQIATIKASASHNAHWFEAKREELDKAFGKSTIDNLITELGNGKTSSNNMSVQTAKGIMEHAEVQLTIDYHEWVAIGKPSDSLRFYAIKFCLQSEPVAFP